MAKNRSHSSEQIDAFFRELDTQTDRGAALVAGAVLDEILQMVITARIRELGSERRDALFGRTRPLDSLSVKIEVAYAIGIYENPFRIQLDIIKDVRNAFAHSIEPLSFDHPDVTKILNRTKPKAIRTDAPPRQHFMGLFTTMAGLLYGLMDTDIRIKPVKETHAEFLREMRAQASSGTDAPET